MQQTKSNGKQNTCIVPYFESDIAKVLIAQVWYMLRSDHPHLPTIHMFIQNSTI